MSIDDSNRGQKKDYEVGYGKPPVGSRFKKGQSGNPRGRIKGAKNKLPTLRAEDARGAVLNEADRLIKITENGRQIEMPVREAVIKSLVIRAIKGNAGAVKLWVQLLEKDKEEDERFRQEAAEGWRAYKIGWEKALAQRARQGIVEAEPPLLHPDDITIIGKHVRISGPMFKREKVKWDWLRTLKAKIEEQIADVEESIQRVPHVREQIANPDRLELDLEENGQPVPDRKEQTGSPKEPLPLEPDFQFLADDKARLVKLRDKIEQIEQSWTLLI